MLAKLEQFLPVDLARFAVFRHRSLQPKFKMFYRIQHTAVVKCVCGLSKNEFLVKNRISRQKTNFWSKVEFLVKKRIFGQNSNLPSKNEFLVKSRISRQKTNLWPKVEFVVKKK